MGVGVQRHAPAALPRERPGTHFIGGRVGPRSGLDGFKKSLPHRHCFSTLLTISAVQKLSVLISKHGASSFNVYHSKRLSMWSLIHTSLSQLRTVGGQVVSIYTQRTTTRITPLDHQGGFRHNSKTSC